MRGEGGATDTGVDRLVQLTAKTSHFASVLKLIQAHVVISGLDSGRYVQFPGYVVLELDKRLHRLRDEVFMKVGCRHVHVCKCVVRSLIPVGVGPFIPRAGPEYTPLRLPNQRRYIPGL